MYYVFIHLSSGCYMSFPHLLNLVVIWVYQYGITAQPIGRTCVSSIVVYYLFFVLLKINYSQCSLVSSLMSSRHCYSFTTLFFFMLLLFFLHFYLWSFVSLLFPLIFLYGWDSCLLCKFDSCYIIYSIFLHYFYCRSCVPLPLLLCPISLSEYWYSLWMILHLSLVILCVTISRTYKLCVIV